MYIIKHNEEEEYFKAPLLGITENRKLAHVFKTKIEAENALFACGDEENYDIISVNEELDNKIPFQSSKVFDGFSTVFRQADAEGTHCKFLHGYGVSFKITFEGDLDHRNWVWDFGGMKRAKNKIDGMNPKEWMDYMFDHTVILAKDDPLLGFFDSLDSSGYLQLRILPRVGAERFAEYIFHKVNEFVLLETEGRVRVKKVKFMEHKKNSATYKN